MARPRARRGAVRVEGVGELTRELTRRANFAREETRVRIQVGYSAPYSVVVHENLEAYHAPPTQAKWLERAQREFRGEVARIIAQAKRAGKALGSAMALGGLALLRLAIPYVPRDTGFLRSSGFVRVERR